MADKFTLDKEGNPVPCEDLIEWGKWMQVAQRIVSLNEINGIKISTVFLGLNHNFYGGDEPVLWETMIFNGKNDSYQERYSSRENALKGHMVALQLVMDETK